jgi:hypothetical protein
MAEIGYEFCPELFVVKLVRGGRRWVCSLVAINFGADEVDVLYDPNVYLRSAHKREGKGNALEGRDDGCIVEIYDAIKTEFTYELICFGSVTVESGGYSSLERSILYSR